MATYAMKFFFDWRSDTCVWSANAAARERYAHAVSLHLLPVSAELAQTLCALCVRHDEALDWACPANGLVWSEEECAGFFREAERGYMQLCRELGDEYQVIFMENAIL